MEVSFQMEGRIWTKSPYTGGKECKGGFGGDNMNVRGAEPI